MPTLVELLTQSGVTIPEGVNLLDVVERSDEIKGLKATKEDLHNWKTANKPILDSLTEKQAELEKAAAKALEEKEALAIQNKDYETLAQLNADKLKKLEDGLNASREKTKKSAHEAAIASVASLFSDKNLGADIAATKAFTTLNDDGDAVTEYRLGDKVFTDLDGLKGAMMSIPSYASAMQVGGESHVPSVNGKQTSTGNGEPVSKPLSKASQNYKAGLI